MSRLTININDEAKKKLKLIAKKKNRTVSELINELIDEESKKIKLKTGKGLGTYLLELPLKEIPDFKNEKEMLAKLKEEKHLRKA